MIGWLIALIAVSTYCFAWFRTAGAFAARMFSNDLIDYPNIFADARSRQRLRVEAFGFGLCVGSIWPLYWAWRWLTRDPMALVPPSDDELRLMVAERDARIAQLEREAGIGT